MDFDGLIDDMRLQTAVYWAAGAMDGFGNTAWPAGVEISVRWENKKELFLTRSGEEKVSKAVVYLDGSQSIAVDDRLYLGELTGLDSAQISAPNNVENAWRVMGENASVDLVNETTLKKVFL